ncbi:hypothetical protein M9Y10_041028 [Tritrichomonas musculus]|uniref:Uncharacterized protein n=1 Tax=Tritrichomonas musculus TaxID=1915356 RepID=A0ABR2K397_9EUKA
MGKLWIFFNNGYTRLAESSESSVEVAAVDYTENLIDVPIENTRMTNTDGFVKLKLWIHATHVKPKFSSLYADDNEESANNPHAMIASYATLNDVYIYYRDSMKPCFNVVCHQLDNINNQLQDLIGDEWVMAKGGVDIVGDNIAALTWTTFNMDEQSNVSYVIKSNAVNYKIGKRSINDLVYHDTTDDLDKRLKALEELKHEPNPYGRRP